MLSAHMEKFQQALKEQEQRERINARCLRPGSRA